MSQVVRPRRGVLAFTAWLTLAAGAAAEPPALVVLISVDQFPQSLLERVAPHLPDGGFRRLLSRGAVYRDAHHVVATTYTGPGHAALATGAYGDRHGIVGNKMYLRDRRRSLDPVRDASQRLVGAEGYGHSPWSLEAETLADRLIEASGRRAKVVSLSLKDRAAIPLAGRHGRAYWLDHATGRFVTSTFYADELPAWLEAFNARRLPRADFGSWWRRRGPDAAYADLRPDEYRWEGDWEGLGRAFPRRIVGKGIKPTASYFKAWATSAYGLRGHHELIVAAIDGEGLGDDEVPDLLAVSLTTLDYAGHQFGPGSHEVTSLLFEADAVIAELLELLDGRFRDRYVLALTADHGAGPLPEVMQEQGEDAGRLRKRRIRRTAEKALDAELGSGRWVVATEAPFVSLDTRRLARRDLDRRRAEDIAAAALRRLPGVAHVLTRGTLEDQRSYGEAEDGPADDASRSLALKTMRSYHPERSGDLVVVTKPYWIWGKYGERDHGTTHGSPWPYDTHVPLIFFGAGIVAGQHDRPVEVIDLAPTLAHLLVISPLADAEGRVLVDALAEAYPIVGGNS